MRVQITTPPYNHRRHGRPWIARVTGWANPIPDVVWGIWVGRPGCEGLLEVEAEPGDILRSGQRDKRRPSNSDSEYHIVQVDGSLLRVSDIEARQHFMSRAAPSPIDSLIAAYQQLSPDERDEFRRRLAV